MKLNSKLKRIAWAVGVLLFWIALWQILAIAVSNRLIVPFPADVVIRLFELILTSDFWIFWLMSLIRVSLGLIISIPAALIMASISARLRIVEKLFSPAVTLMKSIPVVSFILIAIFVIDRNAIPSLITFLMIFPVLYENIREGITQTPQSLLEMAKVFEMPVLIKIKRIYFPSVKPYFFTALCTSVGLALKAGIAAEVVAYIPDSIGKMLSDAKSYMEPADLFAWTAVILISSIILEKTTRYLSSLAIKNRRSDCD